MGAALLLFVAGIFGGILNSVAGGGSFVVFPALMFVGVPPIAANATTTVGLWPAGVASAYAYRRELPLDRKQMFWLVLVSLAGGGLGAWLLLITSDTTFVKMIPFLIGFAALCLTFGPQLQSALARPGRGPEHTLLFGVVAEFLISIYGGYFGGGMGILMLATFGLMGMSNIHAMNGLKNVLSSALNGVALVLFIIAGQARYDASAAIILGGALGGYGGAAIARTIPPRTMRIAVVIFAWLMTAVFTWQAFRR